MSDTSEVRDPTAFDGVSRLLIAAATAALAISAQRWAFDDFATGGIPSPALIAAVAGLSAILAGTNLSLLVRVAIHLGTLWILQQTLGDGWNGSTRSGVLLVSTTAFLGGLALAGLAGFSGGRAAPGFDRPKLTTGDLLATLFAFSVHVAIGQHEAAFVGHETLQIAELAVRHVLVPYAALILAECLIGRGGAAIALALSAGAIALTFPHLAPIDPFATALLVAMRIVSAPLATAIEHGSAQDSRSLA